MNDWYDGEGGWRTSQWINRSGNLVEAYFANGIDTQGRSFFNDWSPRQEYTGEYMERTIEEPEIDWNTDQIGGYRTGRFLRSRSQKKFHGHGTHKVWRVGDRKSMQIFTGQWVYGSKVRGKITTPDCGTYDGEWTDGCPHGRGVWVYTNDSYYGAVKSSIFHTADLSVLKLRETHFKDCRYEGEISRGEAHSPRDEMDIGYPRRHGRGKIICTQGDIFEGQWVDGRLTGQVTFQGSNGDKYEGLWEAHMTKGKIRWSNGDSYEGSWAPGTFVINGHGVFTQAADGTPFGSQHAGHKGEVYDGEWKNNVRWGSCVYTFFNGEKIDCIWEQGRSPKFMDCKRALLASEMQAIDHTMVIFILSVISFSHSCIICVPALAIYQRLLGPSCGPCITSVHR